MQYREQISELRPSLPQQAGRSLSSFFERSADVAVQRVRAGKAPAVASERRRQDERNLWVRAAVQPELDAHKVARAFINLAMDKTKKQNFDLAHRLDQDERTRP